MGCSDGVCGIVFDKAEPDNVNCDEKECFINLQELGSGEEFHVSFSGGVGGVAVSCSVSGEKKLCLLDYVNVVTWPDSLEGTIPNGFRLRGEIVRAPELEYSEEKQCFWLEPNSLRWLSIDC